MLQLGAPSPGGLRMPDQVVRLFLNLKAWWARYGELPFLYEFAIRVQGGEGILRRAYFIWENRERQIDFMSCKKDGS